MGDFPRLTKPMHRIAYTQLSKDQIQAKFDPFVASGPAHASALSPAFAGKSLRIVTDKGLTLAYSFASADKLSVSENGGAPVSAGYGALVQDHIALISHLIPGSQRGYTLVIDQESGIATVFETWFSGFLDNREVQREIHFGYVEQAGKEPPKARHLATNRFEGKGFHWKQDTGFETLEYYASYAYSHFVELGRDRKNGFCAPSDYIRINEDFYIYTRVECEFSGALTLAVVDLNREAQIGVRLGFDESDALHYYVFRAKGTWTGQIAQFEKFGDIAGNSMPPRPVPSAPGAPPAPPLPAKGARAVYRPLRGMPKLTKAQVAEVVARHSAAFAAKVGTAGYQMAGNSAPATTKLAGKTLTLRYDKGVTMEYRFDSPDSLQWRLDGKGAWQQARYQAWEPMPGVFIWGNLLQGTENHDGHIVVADFDNGCATCYNGVLNTPFYANEAGLNILFGKVVGAGIPDPGTRRHGFTTDLIGSAISWNYMPGLTSMHLYSTPHSMSWIIFQESGAGGMQWSGPSGQVKIRDGLYFIYWLEEACNGTLGTILVNMRTMHDAGIGYHCDEKGLSMSQVGAHARYAGRFEVTRFFEPRTA